MEPTSSRRKRAAPAPPGDFITAGGARVHYVRSGDGPPVVYIHGAKGSVYDSLPLHRPRAGGAVHRHGLRPAGLRVQPPPRGRRPDPAIASDGPARGGGRARDRAASPHRPLARRRGGARLGDRRSRERRRRGDAGRLRAAARRPAVGQRAPALTDHRRRHGRPWPLASWSPPGRRRPAIETATPSRASAGRLRTAIAPSSPWTLARSWHGDAQTGSARPPRPASAAPLYRSLAVKLGIVDRRRRPHGPSTSACRRRGS